MEAVKVRCACGNLAYRVFGQPNERWCVGCGLSVHACTCFHETCPGCGGHAICDCKEQQPINQEA